MIELASARWAELEHTYGKAADIPALLRAVAEQPSTSSASGGPWAELWSSLVHQGDIYPASFAAVPHLIAALSENAAIARFDFFLLPACVEVARIRKNVPVPQDLAEPYFQSLQRIPGIAAGALARTWDATLCRSILAALAVAQSQHDTAELLIEIDDCDTAEVLRWYFAR